METMKHGLLVHINDHDSRVAHMALTDVIAGVINPISCASVLSDVTGLDMEVTRVLTALTVVVNDSMPVMRTLTALTSYDVKVGDYCHEVARCGVEGFLSGMAQGADELELLDALDQDLRTAKTSDDLTLDLEVGPVTITQSAKYKYEGAQR